LSAGGVKALLLTVRGRTKRFVQLPPVTTAQYEVLSSKAPILSTQL
jgi:hypothetical protein